MELARGLGIEREIELIFLGVIRLARLPRTAFSDIDFPGSAAASAHAQKPSTFVKDHVADNGVR